MKFKYIFLIIVLLNACTSTDKNYNQYKSGNVDIKFNYLKFEKIELEKIGSSFEGDLILMNDSILFVDKKFCWIYQFDLGGKLKKRCFGRGHGPNEIVKGIKKATSISDTSIILLDRNNYFQFVSSEFKTFKRLSLILKRVQTLEMKENLH